MLVLFLLKAHTNPVLSDFDQHNVILVSSSECDPLSGVQTGVYGGRCDGKRLCEGLS